MATSQLDTTKSIRIRSDADIACNLIRTPGTKHCALYWEMSSSIQHLQDGYDALEAFLKAEAVSRSNRELACVKGFTVGKVKFVIRHQFGKTPEGVVMTPSVFACVVTLAANRLFCEKLMKSEEDMKTAHGCLRNAFADRHGFDLRDPPSTPLEARMFYFYLTTTIGVHALMESDPVHCLTIAKWRLQGSHMKKLGLPGNLIFVDQAYLKCLKAAYGTKYDLKEWEEGFDPDVYVRNDRLLRKVLKEFKFLKSWASSPKD